MMIRAGNEVPSDGSGYQGSAVMQSLKFGDGTLRGQNVFDDRPLYHDDESPHIREIFMGTGGDIRRFGCFSCLTNVNTMVLWPVHTAYTDNHTTLTKNRLAYYLLPLRKLIQKDLYSAS